MVQMPEKVKYIIEQLEKNDFEAYAVGGCVRDSILGRDPEDWDITTSALPQQLKAIFPHTIDTGIQHGTVTVMIDHEGFEVTTYRIDGEYEDARHPKEVVFTSNLIEDLKRRDFTINAMAYNEREGIIDAFCGQEDLKQGIIRCVGCAKERFREDALRMMRAVRFAAQLGFEIEDDTYTAIKDMAGNIAKISAERIQVELTKLLVSDHPERMRTLYESGITRVMLPEFDEMMETSQNNPHHCYSVGEHTIHALEHIEKEKVLRLVMLLHDVSKPECKTTDECGVDHFIGHQEAGAEKASKILRRLKYDNDTRLQVCRLIKWHDANPPVIEKNIRRAIHRVGIEQYPALFAVKRADIQAQSEYERVRKLQYVSEYEAMYVQILEKKQCLSLKELAVSGRDLIDAGMKPGKEIGTVLEQMLEQVLEQPELNEKEKLLKYYFENSLHTIK